jgi:predicted MFS family arabinose efflux permease
MPSIVPEAGLQKANAINALASNAGLILGAASAGILIDTYGAAITLGIDAASFIIAGVLVSTLSHLTPPMANNTNTIIKDLVDGWRVFKSFNWIVIVVVSFSFIVMCWAAAENVLGPLIALEHFNGAKSWSIVITAESAGLVVGALLAIKIKPKYPIRFLQISSFTLCFYMFALAKPQSLLIISICAFFFGITLDLWGTLWYTALHRKVPRDALSRVSSFDALGALIFKPIGLAIAAPISLLIGIDNLIYILIVISVLAISLPLLSADVRNMSYEDSPKS